MKKRLIALLLILCIAAVILNCLGFGLYSSTSAVSDLKTELANIYGPEYSGKQVERGTEDMVFTVKPKTWFLTNWNLRNTFGMDYEYECQVIITTQTNAGEKIIHTITYQAVDPMGKTDLYARAHLDLRSKTEVTQAL